MKPLLSLAFFALLITACNPDIGESIVRGEIVGNDLDDYGCKASAGYIWSITAQKCLRVFEEGIEFHNKDYTSNAFVILSSDKSEAEAFLPIETEISECIMVRNEGRFLYKSMKGLVSIQLTEKEYILNFKSESYRASRTEHLDLLLIK